FIPASATVQLDQVGSIDGTLTGGAVKANAKVDIHLTTVRVFGFPILCSTSCHTTKPADIPLVSAPGFDPLKGGTLTATYAIPRFSGCGFLTGLISAITSGPGNKLEVTLTKK
ncbi:MAG TPA: 5'-nucleotidase, partial [Amycolatopsis sp.]